MKKSDNRIMHIRPVHSAYKLLNGFTKGDIAKDGTMPAKMEGLFFVDKNNE